MKEIKAVVIGTNNSVSPVVIKGLDDLYKFTRSSEVACVKLGTGIEGYIGCDIFHEPINRIGTNLWARSNAYADHPLHGDIVVMGSTDEEGENTDVPPFVREVLAELSFAYNVLAKKR